MVRQLDDSISTPDVDAFCGRSVRFRDLIECGETWKRLTEERGAPFDNVPRSHQTFEAMVALCEKVLDPVIAARGAIELTYGFASRDVTRHIRGNIAPKLDQHAGHERTKSGAYVCPRLGFAVDLRSATLNGISSSHDEAVLCGTGSRKSLELLSRAFAGLDVPGARSHFPTEQS